MNRRLNYIHIRCHRGCSRNGTQRATKVDMKRVANLFAETPGSIVIGNEERAFTTHGDQITVIKSQEYY